VPYLHTNEHHVIKLLHCRPRAAIKGKYGVKEYGNLATLTCCLLAWCRRNMPQPDHWIVTVRVSEWSCKSEVDPKDHLAGLLLQTRLCYFPTGVLWHCHMTASRIGRDLVSVCKRWAPNQHSSCSTVLFTLPKCIYYYYYLVNWFFFYLVVVCTAHVCVRRPAAPTWVGTTHRLRHRHVCVCFISVCLPFVDTSLITIVICCCCWLTPVLCETFCPSRESFVKLCESITIVATSRF